MATEWDKLVTAIRDRLSVWPTFLETSCLVPKVFVKIGPTTCILTILSDLYVQNGNEELILCELL